MFSGFLLTSFLNTEFNDVKNSAIFIRLAKLVEWYQSKQESTAEFDFGDDNIIAIVKEIQSWFNGKTIAEQAKIMFNQTHTSPSKDLDIPETVDLTDAEFLKRSFVPMDGFIVGRLSKESLESMVQWVNKSKTPVEIQTKINMENALREWVYYGKDEYNKHQSIFNAYLREMKLSPISIPYEANHDIMFSFKHQ
jgi:hypothetical protein